MNHMIDALDDVDPEVIARLERKLNDIKHGKTMNPTTRLRCTYALMIVFVAVVIVHMGMFITYQVRSGVFQGPVLNYVLIDMIIAYTLVQIIWRSTRQLVLSQNG